MCWEASAAGAASFDDSLLSVCELSEALPSGMGDGRALAAPLPCTYNIHAQQGVPGEGTRTASHSHASSKAKRGIMTADTGPYCCGDWVHLR